tara:strand:- start:685 stop:1089 length:405 start_codon:yes stop_codon:yes gene_type:complete
MNYQIIKNHIKEDNKNLLKFINEKEIKWLNKHFAFINALLMGRIKRKEKKYQEFINAIQNTKKATTNEERIYLKFTEYFKDAMNKTKVKSKDPNILFNGMEINPTGLRPKGPGVDNVDVRGKFGDNESFRDWDW